MALLRQLLLAMLLSVTAYAVLFLFVLKKPMTVGAATQYIDLKRKYLEQTRGQPRILIFAGSNGRFSHRCSYIEEQAHVACVNLSLAAGSNLVWQFNHYVDFIGKGDLLYLPLEYRDPGSSTRGNTVGEEAPYIVAYEHSALRDFYDPEQALQAVFGFDLSYALSAIAETVLHAKGAKRRFSTVTMDKEGDEKDHTLEKGRSYRDYVATMNAINVDDRSYSPAADWAEVEAVIAAAQKRGVLVVGGLPTTTEDAEVPANVVPFLRAFFLAHGACFVALPNLSRYPRQDFYDSQYHLSEPYQIQHTAALAPLLVNLLKNGTCS